MCHYDLYGYCTSVLVQLSRYIQTWYDLAGTVHWLRAEELVLSASKPRRSATRIRYFLSLLYRSRNGSTSNSPVFFSSCAARLDHKGGKNPLPPHHAHRHNVHTTTSRRLRKNGSVLDTEPLSLPPPHIKVKPQPNKQNPQPSGAREAQPLQA